MARNATVQYRRLNREGFPRPETLKDLVIEALSLNHNGRIVGELVTKRRFDLDQDGRLTLLNKITERPFWPEPFFSGQVAFFEQGANVPAILGDIDADTNELDLGQFQLPNASMIHGLLYFVAVGDHLGIIESPGMRSGRLERFFTQFLSQYNVLEVGHTVVLNALFTNENGRAVSQATEVVLAAEPARRPEFDPGEIERLVAQDVAEARGVNNSVVRVLEALGWTNDDITRLMAQVPPGGWLEGVFKFLIKSKTSRKQTIRRQTLDEALRNVDPKDVTILGKGKREKDGFVKLTKIKSVQTVGSLLEPTSAVTKIEESLKEWSAAGEIDLVL